MESTTIVAEDMRISKGTIHLQQPMIASPNCEYCDLQSRSGCLQNLVYVVPFDAELATERLEEKI